VKKGKWAGCPALPAVAVICISLLDGTRCRHEALSREHQQLQPQQQL